MCNLILFSKVNIIFIWRILNKKYERKKSIWEREHEIGKRRTFDNDF